MEKIYSKCKPDVLLQIVVRCKDIVGNQRINFCPEKEYLQLGSMDIEKGKKYRAHYHFEQNKPAGLCQESWVVIKGSILCYLYDLNMSLIRTLKLEEGDCVLTFQGGHGYEGVSDNSLVYEFKTGPYLGGDKVFIKET